MKKILCCSSILLLTLFTAKAQFADLGIGGIIMPPYGTTSVGRTIQLKADVRNFGFDDIGAGCALVTISVPSAICSITGLNSASSSVWTIFSSSMPASVTLRNTGGPLPADFEPYYIILDVIGINSGGPLTINSHTGLNGFMGGCMASGNLDVYNDDATTSITVVASGAVLPLKFTGFSTKEIGCAGRVSWTTADEKNVSSFDVQQSFDGNSFTTIKTVTSKGDGAHIYELDVAQSQKRMFYRVIGVDFDKNRSYGPVMALQFANCSKATIVQVYPIPALENQKITLQANVNEVITYRLLNMTGNVIQSGSFIRTTQLDVNQKGIYLLEMTSNGFKETQKIVVQ